MAHLGSCSSRYDQAAVASALVALVRSVRDTRGDVAHAGISDRLGPGVPRSASPRCAARSIRDGENTACVGAEPSDTSKLGCGTRWQPRSEAPWPRCDFHRGGMQDRACPAEAGAKAQPEYGNPGPTEVWRAGLFGPVRGAGCAVQRTEDGLPAHLEPGNDLCTDDPQV